MVACDVTVLLLVCTIISSCVDGRAVTTPPSTPPSMLIVYDTYCMIHGDGACNWNGQCMDTDGGSHFYCSCGDGYTGETCDRREATPPATRPPSPTPPTTMRIMYDTYCMLFGNRACNYNGRCVDSNDGSNFRCDCNPGYGGFTCSETTPPATRPPTPPPPTTMRIMYDTYCMLFGDRACNYNGRCVDSNDGSNFRCDCNPGYGGFTCSETTPPTPPPPTTMRIIYDTYCMIYGDWACNNNGRCVDTNSGSYFRCECEEGYSGDTCSNSG